MFVERDFFVGLSDIGYKNKLTNKSLLAFCENVAGLHSDFAGLGLLNSNETHKGWVLLNWEVRLLERPIYGTELKVRTWSKGNDKLYAYRDFEIMDKTGKLLGTVTSKWVLIDLNEKHFVKFTDFPIEHLYQAESKSISETTFPKLVEPAEYDKMCEIKITNDLIDSNEHVHNLNYLNFANQLLDLSIQTETLNLDIMYKKETKAGEIVKCFYRKENDAVFVTVKTEDEKNIHAILKFY